jgi:hypothetical protein
MGCAHDLMRGLRLSRAPEMWCGGAGSAEAAGLLHRTTRGGRSSMTGTSPFRDQMAVPSAVDIPTCTCHGPIPATLVGNTVAVAAPITGSRTSRWSAHAGAGERALARDDRPAAAGDCQYLPIGRANHAIKAWLDAELDRHHPIEKHHPSATGQMSAQVVYAFRKLGPRWRANHAKRVARLAVFA